MEPAELFDICIYRWFRKLAQLVGIDVFIVGFKPTALTLTTISTLFLFVVSCAWTIYFSEFDEKVICCSMLAFCYQGIVKFFSILKNYKSVRDICDFCSKIYRANTASSPNKTLLAKSVKITVFIFKSGMALLITTATLVLLKPFICYIAFGALDPILLTYFPGIDEGKAHGYTILATFHAYITFIFVVGTAGTDLLLMAIVIHAYAMAHIFRNAVNEFNAFIEAITQCSSKEGIRLLSKNLILMHIDYIRFTRTLEEVYSAICLIQITMSNTIMIVLVYVVLMVHWFTAYFLLAVAFFQVFEFSLMGTVLEIANDKMYENICNILVVDLPVNEQKKIILMTLLARNPHYLTIGGFQLLNVETFVKTMKNTYSVGMLLVNTRLK